MMRRIPPPAPNRRRSSLSVPAPIEEARERRMLIVISSAAVVLLLVIVLLFLLLRIWHGDGTLANVPGGAGLGSTEERSQNARADEETSEGESEMDPHVTDRPTTEGEFSREASGAASQRPTSEDRTPRETLSGRATEDRKTAGRSTFGNGGDPNSMAPDAAASNAPLRGPPANSGRRYLTMPGGSFFGLKAEGNKFVYVVDRSSSMRGLRLQRAKDEVQRSVGTLTPEQSFYVIFFNTRLLRMFESRNAPEKRPLMATDDNVARLIGWLPSVGSDGGTYPESSLMAALDLNPSAIFFLTDGHFDANIVERVTAANKGRVQINTVSFVSRGGELLLREFANANRGRYVYVP